MKIKSHYLIASVLLVLSFNSHALICTSADADGNSDGWGWENDLSCIVAIDTDTTMTSPDCIDSPPVGDGWGWNGTSSCRIDANIIAGDCIDTDPTGDGWGWDGVRSCRIDVAECVDTAPVGDGWGWNGTTSCRIDSDIIAGDCIDTEPTGDGWGWDGSASCRIEANVCIDTPPSGDGWGWDGTASCRIDDVVVIGGSCVDTPPSGDGWGWDGVQSCRIDIVIDPGQVNDCSSYGSTATPGTLAYAITSGERVTISCDEAITVPEIVVRSGTTLSISGGHLDGGGNNRVFHIEEGASLALNLTTVSGGYAARGAGILNHGDLNMTLARISNNHLIVDGEDTGLSGTLAGAGIYNTGTMDGTGYAVSNNSIEMDTYLHPALGAGVYNTGEMFGRQITVSNNVLDGSAGGGIYNEGILRLTESRIENNFQLDVPGNPDLRGGGGLYNSETGTLSMIRGVINDNTADGSGGGLANHGQTDVDMVAVENNTGAFAENVDGLMGGGIYNTGVFTFTSGSVDNNSSGANGGGIGNNGTTVLGPVSFEGNSAANYGGGLFNSGDLSYPAASLVGNNANTGGAAANTGSLEILSGSVRDNTAVNYAAVWCESGASLTFFATETNNISENGGDAILECM